MSQRNARRIRIWAAGLVAVAATTLADADTLYVNGDCGNDDWTGTSSACEAPDGPKLTIQAGIDESVDGDMVIVADGTYMGVGNKNLDYFGRLITLRSENGPVACIIDCENDGRGVWFHNDETADAVLEGFTFRNGDVVANGGAILCESASPTILSCILTNNQSRQGGGLFSSSGNPSVSNCTISENASLRGGGLMLRRGSPTVSGCTIVGNWLFGTASGGGMYNCFSDPTVTNCTFTSNTGGHFGGGMYNRLSDPTVTNCTFTSNTGGRYGGGMYNTDGSSPTVTNCSFTGNEGVFWGGGMYSTGSPTVTDCTFSGNSASFGGGMVNAFLSKTTLTNCTFSGNDASRFGGGMHNTASSSPTLINCTFSGNSAGSGGGMYNTVQSTTTLTNCTFSGNSAGSGGGMYNTFFLSTTTLSNCILWNNVPDEIVNVGRAVTTVRFSDVQGGWPGTGNINADPLFVDAANGNYRLAPGSPCIDAADNTAVPNGITTDLDGNPRFVDDPDTPDCQQLPGECGDPPIVDMGAYEFQAEACDPCDVNCDGKINAFDIEPFLECLWGRCDFPCSPCAADANGDGNINSFDIEPFLECLFGP